MMLRDSHSEHLRRFWIAGIPVDVLSRTEIKEAFNQAVLHDRPFVLANINLHGLYSALRSTAMTRLLTDEQTLVHVDGMPFIWAAYIAGIAVPKQARNGHIDLIPELLKHCAENDWAVVIVNSDEEGARSNEMALRRLVPGLKITALPGYFDINDTSHNSEQNSVITAIKEVRPALLLVGMGMPRQERWIEMVRAQLAVPMIMPVGGFADYFAGRTRTPPRFLGSLGLEWLYRLVFAPRRLGFRYLVEPFLLFALLIPFLLKRDRWRLAPTRNDSNLSDL